MYRSPGQTAPATLLFPLHTQKQGGVPPRKNVGAPTFLIFPLIFRTFLLLMGLQQNRGKEEKSWPRKFGRGAKGALERTSAKVGNEARSNLTNVSLGGRGFSPDVKGIENVGFSP
jgi:hypothetical protein